MREVLALFPDPQVICTDPNPDPFVINNIVCAIDRASPC